MNDNLQEKIFFFMRKANRFYRLDNAFDRKQYVIRSIKECLGETTFEIYRDFIDDSIEFLVRLSKNKKILKELQNKKNKLIGFCGIE